MTNDRDPVSEQDETTFTVTHSCGHDETHDLSARPAAERHGFARLLALLPCSACRDGEARGCNRTGRRGLRGRPTRRERSPGCDAGDSDDSWELLFAPGGGCRPESTRADWEADLEELFGRHEGLCSFDLSPVYNFEQAFTNGLTPAETLDEALGRLELPGLATRRRSPQPARP